ncbi:MAG: DUF1553 domain-containing protein [Pedosphaera sp.]|nr:DUF1553 domain-containing protein [Pedosphaera sp.]
MKFRAPCFRSGVVMATCLWANSVFGGGEPLPFRTGILPLLTKAGCNAGACHGAATGQGGFKLSLFGYDPEEDFERITRELGGRRIDRAAPSESLLLRKPSRQLDHEGGRRLPRDGGAYEKVERWIAEGAPFGSQELCVTAITVEPAVSFLQATNTTFNLHVTALLSNGSREDVTTLALYSSNNDAIADVGKQGEVHVSGRGVASVMVRYSGQVGAARVMVPFGDEAVRDDTFPKDNIIDEHIGATLKRLHLPTSPLSRDGEFLRRVHLDLTGRLPSLETARAFLGGPGSLAARLRVIDDLLASSEFVDLWTMRLTDLLLIGGKRASDDATRSYHGWVREQVALNTPYDKIVRALLTARGPLLTAPPANFFTLANDPRDLAEHASRIFLGTQIACARCHAHPADRWTQEDYYRFAAYFARVSHEGNSIKVSSRGEVDHPKTGAPMSPRPLGGSTITPDTEADRRIALAGWMTDSNNPLFARTIVNRIWKALLGRGLVEPVDDLRPTNPATHPALLEALAVDFSTHGHDLHRLIRSIVTSRTYQITSRTAGINRLDDRFFSHAYLKEMPAAVFLDAVAQVTGIPEVFDGCPEGTRAVQLIGVRTPSYALDVLGRCSRDGPCESGGRPGGGLAQALHLINGSTLNAKFAGGIVTRLLARASPDRERIEELYLRALTRLPAAEELAEWEPRLAAALNPSEAVEDLLWTLLNSREFAFNH